MLALRVQKDGKNILKKKAEKSKRSKIRTKIQMSFEENESTN
jgi:hypothetical protein